MSVNITTDFLDVVDELETVRFKRSGAFVEYEISALRRPISKTEAAAGGALLTDLRWHLSASQIDPEPNANDTIRDAAGVTHTIYSVKPATIRTRWECLTRIV